jgi:hypothetical protein
MDSDRKQLPWVGVVTDKTTGKTVQYVEEANGVLAHLATPDGTTTRNIIIVKTVRK